MLTCRELGADRGGQRVLDEVELQIKPGELMGLIGPNGCGKTTLLETIAGVTPLAAGEILFDGKSLSRAPVYARARRGIRLIPDRNMVFGNLSVREHLALQLNGERARLNIEVFAPFRLGQTAGSLSGGEKRILATVGALQSNPRLLLADEFSEGLQYSVVQKMLREVRALCSQGSMAILVVHSQRFAMDESIPAFTIHGRRVVRLG